MKEKLGIRKILCFLFFVLAPFFISPSAFAADSVKGDINNNGVQDLTGFFNSDKLSKIELDRNEDGKIDAWLFFFPGKKTYDTQANYDENFDGRVDEIYFIRNDETIRFLKDQDLDGLLDWETLYASGNPSGSKRVDPPLDPVNLKTT